jgi:uncharacterized protein YbaP (TraB family)
MTGRNFRSCFSSLAMAMTAFIPAVALCDEAKHPAKPLLWKIEGKGLTKPSYLFGTIHIGSPAVVTLHPAAQKAFDGADVVYTEVTMDAVAMLAATQHYLRKDGKSLSESMGKELSARFEEELKHVNPALDAEPFEMMSTWVTAITLTSLPELLTGKPPLDQVLWNNAVKAGKRTGALETTASNAAIFEEIGEEAQLAMLSGTMAYLKKCREEGKNLVRAITDVYLTGDLEGIEVEMNAFFEEMKRGENADVGKRVRTGLLDDRDANMSEKAAESLEKEPNLSHFFAAGAAHFASETGIGARLAKAGYTVTRIEE